MRWLAVCCVLFLVAGCATKREVTISTRPPDATLRIDGLERGPGPITETFTFRNAEDTRRIVASRRGYEDEVVNLRRDFTRSDLIIDLRPHTRRVTFQVRPVPGVVTINGERLHPDAVGTIAADLQFTVDEQEEWTRYRVTAERPGFDPAETIVSWEPEETYVLELQPRRKDVRITTDPPGARVFMDGELLGRGPVVAEAQAFAYDVETNQWASKRLRVERPGYAPIERTISWDEGRESYEVALVPHTKTVRITTDPPGGTVTIDDQELPRDETGTTVATLEFPPVNEQGELITYRAVATRQTADSEWEPKPFIIGWDDGQSRYHLTLKEILTRPVPLVIAEPRRTEQGWQIIARQMTTIAMKDVTEGPHKEPPARLTRLPQGSIIDTVSVSPDGRHILFTVLLASSETDLRSQIMIINADGAGGLTQLTDGRTLELTPSYTPDGTQIVFSSNRGGRRMSIWGMATDGTPGITQYTVGDTMDLWPSIDADPNPRLYYQAHLDNRPDPRLYMAQLGTTRRTDLTHISGTEPRVSPKADAVAFTAINERTGKRDIFLMGDQGGVPRNLTNSPDSDDFSPAWSADGSMIAFVSDRGSEDAERHNYCIWLLDLSRSDRPVQLSINESWDDNPVWAPDGDAVYFRSNRGGEWGIWRISVR